ncbi:hypothetical protein RN001_013717 [Aquatica leii]|uniref:Uncharacterized protein n=1 Tax=Aquatica leii TaxID=1421715 RepID=A0AAN7PS41_9COLE|nr:hypothetical protein RN001_013717 [Aquatica leii]
MDLYFVYDDFSEVSVLNQFENPRVVINLRNEIVITKAEVFGVNWIIQADDEVMLNNILLKLRASTLWKFHESQRDIMDKKQIFNLDDPADVEAVTNLLFADDDDAGDICDESDTDEEEHVSEREDDSESEMSCESSGEDEDNSSPEAYIAHLRKHRKIVDTWMWNKNPKTRSKRPPRNILVRLPGLKLKACTAMMVIFQITLVLLLSFASVHAVQFTIRNNIPGPIWVGIQGNPGHANLNNGGLSLNQNEQKIVNAPDNWAGRVWARTWCDPNTNHCQTGDCGNKFECFGSGGVPPVTLVEITLRGAGNQDFYDVSLVDGYNVLASISPQNGQGNCQTVSCSFNINNQCPQDLKQIGGNGNDVIACYSSCLKYNTDVYCCRGQYNSPQTCKPNVMPQPNSAQYYKQLQVHSHVQQILILLHLVNYVIQKYLFLCSLL